MAGMRCISSVVNFDDRETFQELDLNERQNQVPWRAVVRGPGVLQGPQRLTWAASCGTWFAFDMDPLILRMIPAILMSLSKAKT